MVCFPTHGCLAAQVIFLCIVRVAILTISLDFEVKCCYCFHEQLFTRLHNLMIYPLKHSIAADAFVVLTNELGFSSNTSLKWVEINLVRNNTNALKLYHCKRISMWNTAIGHSMGKTNRQQYV